MKLAVITICHNVSCQGLQDKFCNAEQDWFGDREQAETSLKIDKSEFFYNYFLSKLTIVENTLPKKKENSK